MRHHAEAEAVDLLMETERLDLLPEYVTEKAAAARVCLYLSSCVPYVPDPENTALLEAALGLFRKFKKYPQVRDRVFSELGLVHEVELLFKKGLAHYSNIRLMFGLS